MKNNLIIGVMIVVVVIIGYLAWPKEVIGPIGGDRNENGCLVAAGYSFNETAGACVREFEITPDILRAAGVASEYLGRSYGLTVTSFNSYEEPNSYDITLENINGERWNISIKDWRVTKILMGVKIDPENF